MTKSIIIIGAGIAGLSAGCYAQMNGYNTKIFEMHEQPGGVCTSWDREGYTIDGCIHWLVGSRPDSSFNHMWRELGAVQGRNFVDYEEFGHLENEDGKVFTVYTNLDRLEKHMKELAPEDNDVIGEFINGAYQMTKFNLPWDKAPELYTPLDGIKMIARMMPVMGTFNKWRKISVAEYANRFRNPFLRRAFHVAFAGELEDFSVLAMLFMLGWMHNKDAGYPLGGSLDFARSIEKRYLNLGGQVNYKAPVSKILTEKGKAVGIQLADGTVYQGDIIISAADGHRTLFEMLDGAYLNNKIRDYYRKLPVFPPLIFVALGVARSFAGLPHHFTYLLNEPINIANIPHKEIALNIFNYDPGLAPTGKTVIIAMLGADYNYWQKLYQENIEQYKAEKEKIAGQIINFLDSRYPGLAALVEMHDVATPVTWERYSGNWKGAFEGWLITTRNFMLRMSKQLPGLKDFYMIGQWVEPGGGVPVVAMSGRNAIQIICKRDNKPFVAATA